MKKSNGTARDRFPGPLSVCRLTSPPRGSIGAAGLSELAYSLSFALAAIGIPILFRSAHIAHFGLPLCVYIGSVTIGVACFYQTSGSWKSWSKQIALELGRALGFAHARRLSRIGYRLSVLALFAILLLSLRLNPLIPDEKGSGALAIIRIPLLVNIMFFFSCFVVVFRGAAAWIDSGGRQ